MADSPNAVFEIRKIYTKDISFESPKAPAVFLENSKNPNIDMQVTIIRNALEPEDYFEVILKLTATAQVEESPLFLIEIEQAGVFQIKGIKDENLELALEVASPNILLPFAREAISDLVTKGGFPQFLIAPINFESLYQQKKQTQAAAKDENTAKH
jgi:preprotein translocase subunit SecB